MSCRMWDRMLQEWANVQFETLVKDDATACLNDLFNGPLYLDPEGNPCDPFDEGVTRFNFSTACERICAALDHIGDVWVDIQAGEVLTQEPDWDAGDTVILEDGSEHYDLFNLREDYVHFDRAQVIAAIVGKELAKYVA